MLSPKELTHLIEEEIEQLNLPHNPQELYAPIRYLMGLGGKRMRPILCLMGANLFSEHVEIALKPALAIEVFHNFTLMHDDIMDAAPLRRGRATVHERWDSNVAILSGDVMLVKAYELLMHLPDLLLRKVLNLFNRTAAEVCEGQQLDMNFEQLEFVSEQEYLEMIRLKTAVLLGASLQMGALCAHADDTQAELLYEFGKNLGIAFQLQDDLLDVYGEPDKFGKQVGGDIIANKKTFLLIKALELAKGEHKVELDKWLSMAVFMSDHKVKAVTEVYDALGVRQLAEEKMQEYVSLAEENLRLLEVSEEGKEGLMRFVKGVMEREA